MDTLLKPSHFHDLGKLSLAFVMLWAYFNFSQFLLVYAANLVEEIPYFIARISHGWQYLAAVSRRVPFRRAVLAAAVPRSEADAAPPRLGRARAAGRSATSTCSCSSRRSSTSTGANLHLLAGEHAAGLLRALARSGGAARDWRPVAVDVLHAARAAAAAGGRAIRTSARRSRATGGH